jgi:hypothetical protein
MEPKKALEYAVFVGGVVGTLIVARAMSTKAAFAATRVASQAAKHAVRR